MTLNEKIKKVRDCLTPVCENVYHYWRLEKNYPCIVWQEDSEIDQSFDGDNHRGEQAIHGTVDVFTLTEFDSLVDNVQTALDSAEDIAWRLNSVQFEDETSLIHYEWEFEVM